MDYKIGDTVVHWTHGIGKVIAIDEMQLSGVMQAYYVVEVGLLKLWVPKDETNKSSIRLPFEGDEFMRKLNSLQTLGEKAYLLDEWVLSLCVERENAQSESDVLLHREQSGIGG